jgi:hypothetical protein
MNAVANARVLSSYVTGTPTVFFDGGYEVLMGGFPWGGGDLVPYYESMIQSAGQREVPPIDLVTAIDWLGDFTVRVHVAVANGAPANTPPAVPSTPMGPTAFRSGESGTFETESADAESNLLYYQWDWGDGQVSEWLGPFDDEAKAMASHNWAAESDYGIMVRVKDPFGEMTDWSPPLSVSVSCCVERVGDTNLLGGDEPTIGDVSLMIDAKFISGDQGVLECLAEADINQSGGVNPTDEDITIGDISVLIDYLFITGSSLGLPDCP